MVFSYYKYLWLKYFHAIPLVVVALVGLFYLVRLFIYHVEVQTENEGISNKFNNQYKLI